MKWNLKRDIDKQYLIIFKNKVYHFIYQIYATDYLDNCSLPKSMPFRVALDSFSNLL